MCKESVDTEGGKEPRVYEYKKEGKEADQQQMAERQEVERHGGKKTDKEAFKDGDNEVFM